MKTYQKVTETITRDELTDTICDICGVSEDDWKSYDGKRIRGWRQDDVDMSHRYGDFYPEGGSGERLDLDICPGCFVNKVLPFIKSISVVDKEIKSLEYESYDV